MDWASVIPPWVVLPHKIQKTDNLRILHKDQFQMEAFKKDIILMLVR